MEFQQGKRIKNVEANVAGMRTVVNKALYDNWSYQKTKYSIKDLKSEMKIWQKIFMHCIHPRTGGTDYLNATQKVIMYYISTGELICLPFLLFNYLKECVEKSRTTTGSENKRFIYYIPYGRLLSDIFVQNKLVKTLSDLGLHEDLAMTIGDALNGIKLKKMQIIEKIQVAPKEDTSDEVRQRDYPIDDFPIWSKKDNPACILEYVRMLRRQGDPITLTEFVNTLPESPPKLATRKSRGATSSKPSDPKGKGILIEEPAKKKAASKTVIIREPSPERPLKRTSAQQQQMSDSESSEDTWKDSSSEETEDEDMPLAKRRKIILEEEEDEQDDHEIIQNVIQGIREASDAEESTDSDAIPVVKRRKLPLRGPLQQKETAAEQASEPTSEVQRERRSKRTSDPARAASLTRTSPIRSLSKVITESINSDSALVVIPEQPMPISTSLPTSTQTEPIQPETQPQTQAEPQAPKSPIQTATTAIPSTPIYTSSTSIPTEPIPHFNSFIQGIVQHEATLRTLVQQFSPKPASTSHTLLITQTGEIPAEAEKEDDDDVQILVPPFNVKPLQQIASNFEDQIPDAGETSYVSLSNYSAVNSQDLSFTSPEKAVTSRQRPDTISEAEHMAESDHSGIVKDHEIASTHSEQLRPDCSNASSSNTAKTSQPDLTLATSLRPQNLIQLIQEFSEEATRRLQWLYQVTDNQLDASFVDSLWSAFGRWSENRGYDFQKQLDSEKRIRIHNASERAYEQRQRVLHKVCEPLRRAVAARDSVISECTLDDAEIISEEAAEESSEGIVILEDVVVNEVEQQEQIQVDTAMFSESEVATHTQAPEAPPSAPAPEVATLAARIDRIQDDQQRLF
ncbi:uncharacterized protein LOC130746982 [Lotus japonicus]|uniref:uncharacterized protein LOC130746982 n=1 Tax=Lotus japonicus TaxID=34305 RepID=UPI00258BF95E|nr:uncharacterized protein LOC130746982 [Lotus japonicus]XP_057455773.1 uncharacterized protein LOC130746982 [Lotus japonicus]